ncbi:TIGR04282 family arsenosugar biosynthesis glycosyltransferase [Marinobacter zhanjiangensis]|uniref:Glycosyltransferase n=1 Tax=Marinobacter zhanjiangensis TaxID=578215 RepID=A0ABQ3AYX9_9GAMM|nr:TIGR04282 family arsenosugar biosynthesis glycosyltransferase [Marinobacter zhanjiangensis]GGY71199.1 hypothetical protein GCM10007071_17970 [Marinobacter zhanjiangensis]
MTSGVQLIQFAKWPQRGRVKTRLASALGDEGALDAHIRLTLTVMERLVQSGLPVTLAWDRAMKEPPAEAEPILKAMAASRVAQSTQQGADLGERMTRALASRLLETDIAMVVGSDCPSVDAAYIEQARQALRQADVVFGPSDDGGYVLIAARRTQPEMLQGVAWGSEDALEQSVAAVRNAGLGVATLSPLWDVDELADWDRFLKEFGQSSTGG